MFKNHNPLRDKWFIEDEWMVFQNNSLAIW